ncbi:ArsR/SmtB family transcription factor [Candidatus Avelusimicrobium aviculae]|uniref:ArsR/SmtB family transcription factor n=1 Tax=Candidatus Avelusimicrobium aviculae TaxID=3416206 RepID=UPI003D09F8AC
MANLKKQAGFAVCAKPQAHKTAANALKKNPPQEEELYDLADLFKAFADSSRIKILWALSASEFCVCDLADALKMTQSAVSHQLRLLKQSRLVKSSRQGQSIIYCLADEHVKKVFTLGLEHVREK